MGIKSNSRLSKASRQGFFKESFLGVFLLGVKKTRLLARRLLPAALRAGIKSYRIDTLLGLLSLV